MEDLLQTSDSIECTMRVKLNALKSITRLLLLLLISETGSKITSSNVLQYRTENDTEF